MKHLVYPGYSFKPEVSFTRPNSEDPSQEIGHVFITAQRDGSQDLRETILIDGTWQQFLPLDQRRPKTPKVLIGTRDSFVQRVAQYGVSNEAILDLWLPDFRRTHKHPSANMWHTHLRSYVGLLTDG